MHRDYVTAVLLLAAIFSIPFLAHAADVPRPLFAPVCCCQRTPPSIPPWICDSSAAQPGDSREAARMWRLAAAQGSVEATNNLRRMACDSPEGVGCARSVR
jgi:hypothetical protein